LSEAYENHKKLIIEGFRGDSRTRHVPNTCLERYSYSNTMNLAKAQVKQPDRYTLKDSVRNKVWPFLSNESVKVEPSLNCSSVIPLFRVCKTMEGISFHKEGVLFTSSYRLLSTLLPRTPDLKLCQETPPTEVIKVKQFLCKAGQVLRVPAR